MKKTISLLLAFFMCVSLCACGSGEASIAESTTIPENNEAVIEAASVDEESPQEETVLSESDKAAVEMANDAVSYLKTQLLYPESFTLASVSYTSSIGESIFKIVFTAKNSYGGEIDTAAYFTYNETEKVFADTYQTRIDLAEAQNNVNSIKQAQDILAGKDTAEETNGNDTSIFIEKAYFLDASETAGNTYAIYEKSAIDINIGLIN